MKKTHVLYYSQPYPSLQAKSEIVSNENTPYVYSKTKISTKDGFETEKNKHIYYRSFVAQGVKGKEDSVWESITINIEDTDVVIGEANYVNAKSSGGILVTSSDQQIFTVVGARGKYAGATKIIIDYDNNLDKEFTPEWMKKGPIDFKFRKITIS